MEQNDTSRRPASAITQENLWDAIVSRQGETFYTAKGLPFTYLIKGGEFFTERKKKSITRATFERAYQKIVEDTEGRIIGPKTLNCFGGPYVWAVFVELGIVGQRQKEALQGGASERGKGEKDEARLYAAK